jgi:hypothetical protein
MTKRALLVGAASSLAASAIAASLRDNGEATLIDGELIDPDRVILGQTGGQIAEIFVKSPIPTTDSDGLPNRLSIDRNSPHYTNCGAFVGVKIDGEEAPNCIEFCVSEGWVRLGSGGAVTRAEVKHAERKYGKVEVYWRSPPSRQVRRQMARMAR